MRGADDGGFRQRLEAGRADPGALTRLEESELIMAVAPHLEAFIGDLFGIADELASLKREHDAQAPVYQVRRKFVQRRAVKKIKAEEAAADLSVLETSTATARSASSTC